MDCILSIDVGGTYMKSAIVRDETVSSLPKIRTPRENMDGFLEAINALCNQEQKIDGIALCVPGVLDEETGFMYTGGSLSFIRNADMPALIRAKCGDVQVNIVNDAKAAAKAELECGALKEVSDGIILTIGTAIGGAVIYDRQIVSGSHHFAGEFSYMNLNCLNSHKPFTFWGQMGCQKLSEIYAQKTRDECSPEEILMLAKDGSRTALESVETYSDLLIPGIANLQCLIDPETIAIGGGISANNLFIETLQKRLEHYMEICIQQVGNIPSASLKACGFHDNTVGAYICFKEKFRVQK